MELRLRAFFGSLFSSMLVLGAPSAFAQNVVQNPSFEQPAVQGSALNVGGNNIPGWFIEGNMDLVRTLWQHAAGSQSLELNGTFASSLFQPLTTQAGQNYVLQFAFTGSPFGFGNKTMKVFWRGSELGTYTKVANDTQTQGDMQWLTHSVLVCGTGSDVLKFSSTTGSMNGTQGNSSSYGPTLDAVSVAPLNTGSVASISLFQLQVVGGASTGGVVTLNEPAGSFGTIVHMVSHSQAITVPEFVTFSPGSTSRSFLIKTAKVNQVVARQFNAKLNGTTKTATMLLTPYLKDLTFSPAKVPGGTLTTGTVTLAGPAPSGGTRVQIVPNSSIFSAPAEVIVPGGSTSGTFNLATQPVGTTVQRTVSATLADVTRTAVLTVTTSLYTLSVNPSTVKGGNSTTGTVTLTGPATAGGQPVNIWSDSSAFVLPQTVTVPAGNSSTTFTVGTKPVGATVTRYLKATLGGTTRTAAVTLTP